MTFHSGFGLSVAHWLVVLSAVLSISGASIYIRDTLRGITKPNRVSYFLWAVAPLISTFAALSAHADAWATVRIFMAGFTPLLIFLASFVNPKSYWKLTKFDLLCGAFSLIALIAWGMAGAPTAAILFAAIADGFASIPTLVKAWRYPDTETGISYVASFVSALIIIPAIPVWNIQNAAFQVYLLIANFLLMLTVYRKRLRLLTGAERVAKVIASVKTSSARDTLYPLIQPKMFHRLDKTKETELLRSDTTDFAATRRYLAPLIAQAVGKFSFPAGEEAEVYAELDRMIPSAAQRYLANPKNLEEAYSFATYFTWYIGEAINSRHPVRKKQEPTE